MNLINGDCKKKLKDIPDNSVDGMVTDPPYGYSFMGKDWDKAVIGVDVWKQCLRVLKPGSFALIMCAPRQDLMGKMISNLMEAGFNMQFTGIKWAYASGFPKAGNASKLADKRMGVERDKIPATGGLHKNNNLNDDNWNKIGQINPVMASNKPASPEAKKIDGSYLGFQPKPAVEEILVCMKPLSEKSYINQAIKDGKGVTWLDDCRIPYTSEADKESTRYGTDTSSFIYGDYKLRLKNKIASQTGRFPANLLVSDGSLNDGKITKSRPSINRKAGAARFNGTTYAGGKITINKMDCGFAYDDSGSFSRYFDLDKWAETQFLIVPKPSQSEKERGLDDFFPKKVNDGRKKDNDTAYQRGKTMRKNTHPTVKPIKLFSYLITMISRKGDVILDPFMGSGTSGISAAKSGREYIGIEKEKEWYGIAKARTKAETLKKNEILEKFTKS